MPLLFLHHLPFSCGYSYFHSSHPLLYPVTYLPADITFSPIFILLSAPVTSHRDNTPLPRPVQSSPYLQHIAPPALADMAIQSSPPNTAPAQELESYNTPDQLSSTSPQTPPIYSKANLRHSNSISLTRSYAPRTRQRATSLAGANPLSEANTPPVAAPAPAAPSSTGAAHKGRKRLSMNFALPVVSSASAQSPSTTTPRRSSGYHPATPLATNPTHSKTLSYSHTLSSPIGRNPLTTSPGSTSSTSPKHRQTASMSVGSSAAPHSLVTSPSSGRRAVAHNPRAKNASIDSSESSSSSTITTTNSISNSHHPHHTPNSHNESSPSVSSPGSSNASAIEYYFSQLAYRERRVVELRDEIKRMQLQLRQAEDDLTEFRKQVPTELTPAGMQPQEKPVPAPSNSGLSRSHTVAGTAAEEVKSSRRLSYIHSPFTLMDSLSTREEPKKHRLAASSSSISSAGSSIISQKTTRHSNSLSDSSSSSVEVLDEVKPMVASTLRKSQHSHSQSMHPNGYAHSHHASSLYQHEDVPREAAEDDMFHKGRRVVEEIGSQFWSFFEDIKNVTVGEEARDTKAYPERVSSLNPRKPRRRYEEPATEAVVTSVAGTSTSNLQRRASSGIRASMSMGNLKGHAPEKDVAGKNLRSVPEASSNSYYIV